MPNDGGILDFRAVDGVGFAAERGRLDQVAASLRLHANRIGPLLEILHLHESGLLPVRPVWLDPGVFDELRNAVIDRRPRWTSTPGCNVGMVKLASQPISNDWTAFAMDAKRAAIAGGFGTDWAGQIVAAIRELDDNAREHSDALETAYAAFHGAPGTFEFVVADRGVGVLATMRQAAEYGSLSSDGLALQAALTEGVSRSGSGIGRGFGYRPLFTGLVNRRATLRFRTGFGSLTMDGLSPSLPSSRIGEKPRADGLFVSVCCTLD